MSERVLLENPPIPKEHLEGAVTLPGDSYEFDKIVLTTVAVYARSKHGVWIELRPLTRSQQE